MSIDWRFIGSEDESIKSGEMIINLESCDLSLKLESFECACKLAKAIEDELKIARRAGVQQAMDSLRDLREKVNEKG